MLYFMLHTYFQSKNGLMITIELHFNVRTGLLLIFCTALWIKTAVWIVRYFQIVEQGMREM